MNTRNTYKPIKPFTTYQQQIKRLTNDKKLIINDKASARTILRDISYYALIGGYKAPFYNVETRTYSTGTTLEDIVTLYYFDKALRELVLDHLSTIEQKLRSVLSYAFCEMYSNAQNEYLNPGHYQNTRRSRYRIDKLIHILDYIANKDTQHGYIVYQRNTYGNVPLYAAVKAMTFGQVSAMYSLLPPKLQINISREFGDIRTTELLKYLHVLTHFRNVCAHLERLFSYKDRYDIPDTPMHTALKIPQNGQQYLYGKHDVFAVVIAFCYLLPKKEFIHFIEKLSALIHRALQQLTTLTEEKLLTAMGFPENWKDIRIMTK